MYENAKYINNLSGETCAIGVDKSGLPIVVPLDPANTDYANIMELVDKGELVIAPAEGDPA